LVVIFNLNGQIDSSLLTVVHQSMRMANRPSSTIGLPTSHILLMYLSDNVYRLQKQGVVQPSCEHVIGHFLIWSLSLSDKLSLQLLNNKSKCRLALLYARRSCIYNNMLQLCLATHHLPHLIPHLQYPFSYH